MLSRPLVYPTFTKLALPSGESDLGSLVMVVVLSAIDDGGGISGIVALLLRPCRERCARLRCSGVWFLLPKSDWEDDRIIGRNEALCSIMGLKLKPLTLAGGDVGDIISMSKLLYVGGM